VLSRLLKALRGMLGNAHERGELAGDALVRFPMLLGAPGIIAIVWSVLDQATALLRDAQARLNSSQTRLTVPSTGLKTPRRP
jgi:hypothetical protein